MAIPDADLRELSDLCTPWCVHVVATLRIAEYAAAGTSEVRELAAAAGCDAGALHNVLSHLAGKGVFVESSPGRFALNQAARGLLDPALRTNLDLAGVGGRFAAAWSTLPGYVRTGSSGYQDLFGRPFWEDLDANPALAASFDDLIGPTGHGSPDPQFDLVGGWEPVQTVVDVGGGTGAMLAAILRARPELRGTLVDLPRTMARATEVFGAAGVTDRVTMVGQSFFDRLPAGADLYLLRSILNDWPDLETVAILGRCAEAARPSGRIVVMGGVAPDGAHRGLTIEMVLLGGTTNNLTRFRKLAGEAGLAVLVAERQPSGRFVVECRAE